MVDRTYNIPLKKEVVKVPPYKRAKKAISAVRKFLIKHMKSEDVRIGFYLNKKIWERGIKNPPHHVNVEVSKDDKGVVRAELVGAPKPKVEEKKTKKAGKSEEKKEAVEKAVKDAVKAAKTEEKPEAKKAPKVEKKEEKPAEKKEEVPKAADLAKEKSN